MIALLVDIGNSRIKWRIAHIDPGHPQPRWLTADHAFASTDRHRIEDAFTDHGGIAVDCVLCSNVSSDDVEEAVRFSASRIWPAAAFRSLRPTAREAGVVNGYREPAKLGPDRWLAMIGAHARFPARTLLVCSFGTATTIDLLVATDDGGARFAGGLILPGFAAMRTALSTGTARLPLAEGRTVDFADDTDDAIASGIAAAQAGAVERAWRSAAGTAPDRPVACVLAGGGATTMASLLTDLDADVVVAHDLVLLGIAAVACSVAAPLDRSPRATTSTH